MKKKKKVTPKVSATKKKAKKKVVNSKSKPKPKRRTKSKSLREELTLHEHYDELRKQIESLWIYAERSEERLQDLEIHVNLLTRLFTTLCIEKFGMRVGVLKRIIKRVEEETIRDSQIDHLEFLYKLPMKSNKKRPKSPPKDDPWDQIS